jgi:hypothetical protein
MRPTKYKLLKIYETIMNPNEVTDRLNELLDEGWEVVSHCTDGECKLYTFVLAWTGDQ